MIGRRGEQRRGRRPERGEAAAKPNPEPASQQGLAPQLPLPVRIGSWFLRHAQVMVAALGKLWRAPLSSFMTVAVIGIALALPLGLYILLDNLESVSRGWDGQAQISLFLEQKVSDGQARELADKVRLKEGVGQVTLVGRDQALDEFRRFSGFGDALSLLDDNPLPAVLVVTPALGHDAPEAAEALLRSLRLLPEVDLAQLDLQWVKRLHAIMETVQRGVLLVAALLALAVLLIVGNTIRLEIQNRRDEIVIAKLIGATDAFIRRPFLYGGLWYGLLGGLLAWLLVSGSLAILDGPVQRLAGLYSSDFELTLLTPGATLALFLAAAGLGLLGSWLAVGRHLSRIEPT